jgi:hypothetical protein
LCSTDLHQAVVALINETSYTAGFNAGPHEGFFHGIPGSLFDRDE